MYVQGMLFVFHVCACYSSLIPDDKLLFLMNESVIFYFCNFYLHRANCGMFVGEESFLFFILVGGEYAMLQH